MASVEEKIKKLVEENGTTLSWLAIKVGMSKSGFYKMIETGSIRVDILQKIADVFKVPIEYFFIDKVAELENRLEFSLQWAKEINLGSTFYSLMILGIWGQLEGLIKHGKPVAIKELQKVVDNIDKSITGYQNHLTRNFTEEEKSENNTFINTLKSIVLSGEVSEEKYKSLIESYFKDKLPDFKDSK